MPYHETAGMAAKELTSRGIEFSMRNPNGKLPTVFYLPILADFEHLLRSGILTIPMAMFSQDPSTRVDGVRISIPGIMPDYKTGRTERYALFKERLDRI